MASGYRYPGGLTDADFGDGLTTIGYQPQNYVYGSLINIDEAGTVTALGVRTQPASGTPALKIALFNSSGALIGSGTLTNSAGLAWKDSGAVSLSVSAGNHYVLVSSSTTDSQYGYDNSGNGMGETVAYASFPPASISTTLDEGGTRFGVRLYLTVSAGATSLVVPRPTKLQSLLAR
jgi:hypothetical protein